VLLLFSKSGIIPIDQILLPQEISLNALVLDVVVVFVFSLFHSFNGIIFFLAIVLYDLVQNGLLLLETAAHAMDGLQKELVGLRVFTSNFALELLENSKVSLF
jgi:hypothetical protein